MGLRLVKRLNVNSILRGYIVADEVGNERPMLVEDIIAGIKSGTLEVENAIATIGSNALPTLKGKGCQLMKLPCEAHKKTEPFFYRACHWQCEYCVNNGVEPICSECIDADDERGFVSKVKTRRFI